MTTAIIADDEALLRFHLRKELSESWPQLEIIAEAANGDEALQLIAELRPDIAFLDIKMPGLTGLQVAEQLPDTCLLVFITAFDEFAVQAFEQEAIDYLLKPIESKRIDKMVSRLQDKLSAREQPRDLSQALSLLRQSLQRTSIETESLRWLKALKGDELHLININDVVCFHAEDKYTRVITAQGEYLIRMAIKLLEEQLDGEEFWRIHRSTIVRVEKVERVSRGLSGKLTLALIDSSFKPIVSRSYADKFKQM